MSLRARFRREFAAAAGGAAGFNLDVELELPARGVSALFGPSGSGKTTLLRCLAGLERAPGGFLEVAGECWQDDSRGIFLPTHRRPLGLVFQEASLFPHLSVGGNLDFARRRAGRLGASAAPTDFGQVLELLGIGQLLDRRPGHLSGGERQRVAIARALLTRPRLLLMDEPLAALDQSRKNEILPYLERLHEQLALPVVYVSHAVDEVARLADTLVLLDSGRVLAAGPLAELLARVDLPPARSDDAAVVISARVAVHDAQWGLSRVDFAGGSFWLAALDKPLGAPVRLRVPARDVSIALIEPAATSILNILPATVGAIEHDAAGRALVRLQVGGQSLLARITRRSAARLGLVAGSPVVAQVKGVAVLG